MRKSKEKGKRGILIEKKERNLKVEEEYKRGESE
jgi:hypothetical protein